MIDYVLCNEASIEIQSMEFKGAPGHRTQLKSWWGWGVGNPNSMGAEAPVLWVPSTPHPVYLFIWLFALYSAIISFLLHNKL